MDKQLGRPAVSRIPVKGARRRRGTTALLFVAYAALGLCSTVALASEGGGNSYPIGVETNYVGMMLAEGLTAFLYYQHYDANELKDNNGNNNSKIAYFRLVADIGAVRLTYVWPGIKLFGANIETRVVQPFASVDLSREINRPGYAPLDSGGNSVGLGDTAFAPIILGWHLGNYHQTIGLDTFLADGSYNSTNTVNIGRNYYQFAPFFAFTWFPIQNGNVSAKFRYAFNTRNNATDYQTGDEATIEFSAGYRPFRKLEFGINGYIYRQTTNDVQQGRAVNGNGNRGKVNALGPYLCYNITPKIPLLIKAEFEFGARNRPQGTRIWAQTMFSF
jgi:hypothetical protein